MESGDLRLLLTLDALLQEANVTRAAQRLGLSTPAASHALARIRTRMGDQLLVRAGRSMVLTPRAEALRPHVRSLVEDARRVLSSPGPFEPRTLEREFTIFAPDHILFVMGPIVDRIVREEAPDVALRFLPSAPDDWIALRDGTADMSVCMPGRFPPEFRTRPLLTERFVCVVRQGHPRVRRRLSIETYLALDHVVVAPLGQPSTVDEVLAARGLRRRIRRTVPYFGPALSIAASTDYILTVSDTAARAEPELRLRIVPPPLPLASYALNLLWHPRLDNEPANRWLRGVFARASRAAAVGRTPPKRSATRP